MPTKAIVKRRANLTSRANSNPNPNLRLIVYWIIIVVMLLLVAIGRLDQETMMQMLKELP